MSIKYLEKLRNSYACRVDESPMYNKFSVPRKAEGMWIWMENGDDPYLDLVLGYSSLNFGHNHPEILKAVVEGTNLITQVHSFHTRSKLELSKLLVDNISSDFNFKVYFDIGGSSVVSAAMRLARFFKGRPTIVSFDGAFHGVGYGPASISDPRLLNQIQYGIPKLSSHVVRIPYPNEYYGIKESTSLKTAHRVIKDVEPAAVIMEPVQGAGGFVIPSAKFIKEIRRLTEEYGVLLIDDEIQIGVGRTGSLYAIREAGVIPDVILLSKSLAGGVYPLSAIIARSELFEKISPIGTAFQSTFNNNPFGTYIGKATLEFALKNRIFEGVKTKGEKLLNMLQKTISSPNIQNIRGVGLAIAFDIVDANGPNSYMAKNFVEKAFDQKILVYASGVDRNTIKLAPPLTVTGEEINLITKKVSEVANTFIG